MNNWRNFAAMADLDEALAATIAENLAADIASRGQASLAVSGGNTPQQMFRRLARCELDWSRVWVTLVDDRWVDPQHEDSNERLVRQNLLQAQAAAAHFVGLKTAHETPAQGLGEVTENLRNIPRPFSAVILGMGNDGHTASWFPQADNLPALLDLAGQDDVAAVDPVTAPHPRITLTLPAVLDCSHLHLEIAGAEKRSVLESATEHNYPVNAVMQQTQPLLNIWWAAL